jgi:hypothetical protein
MSAWGTVQFHAWLSDTAWLVELRVRVPKFEQHPILTVATHTMNWNGGKRAQYSGEFPANNLGMH